MYLSHDMGYAGKLCIEVAPNSKIAFISEEVSALAISCCLVSPSYLAHSLAYSSASVAVSA